MRRNMNKAAVSTKSILLLLTYDLNPKQNALQIKFIKMVKENTNASDHNPVVSTLSLPSLIQEMKRESSWEKSGRSAKTLYKEKGMRLVLNCMKAGTEIKPHQANGPISVHCLEGQLKFHTAENSVTLNQGEVLTLQEYIRHSVEAIEETSFLLTIIPLPPNG